jgi:hypothetical protein
MAADKSRGIWPVRFENVARRSFLDEAARLCNLLKLENSGGA